MCCCGEHDCRGGGGAVQCVCTFCDFIFVSGSVHVLFVFTHAQVCVKCCLFACVCANSTPAANAEDQSSNACMHVCVCVE